MSQMIFISMMVSNSLGFFLFKHPMAMGISLMMHTLMTCIITNSMAQNTWFSYILFIVFLGGMLVLFIYMTSVASNELLKKNNVAWKAMATTIMIMFMLTTLDPLMTPNMSQETNPASNKMYNENLLTEMFNYPYDIMTIVAVLYLFLTLIVVVKITESHQGPLRSN